MDERHKALVCVESALELDPTNDRILNNQKMMLDTIHKDAERKTRGVNGN